MYEKQVIKGCCIHCGCSKWQHEHDAVFACGSFTPLEHNQEVTFKCRLCNTALDNADAVMRHINLMHRKDLVEQIIISHYRESSASELAIGLSPEAKP